MAGVFALAATSGMGCSQSNAAAPGVDSGTPADAPPDSPSNEAASAPSSDAASGADAGTNDAAVPT